MTLGSFCPGSHCSNTTFKIDLRPSAHVWVQRFKGVFSPKFSYIVSELLNWVFRFRAWVFRFRVLRASFSNIGYFFFEFKVLCQCEFSMLCATNDLSICCHHCVCSDDCTLRRLVIVSGVVVSRVFKSLLSLYQSIEV